jgi:hypothetical protein
MPTVRPQVRNRVKRGDIWSVPCHWFVSNPHHLFQYLLYTY